MGKLAIFGGKPALNEKPLIAPTVSSSAKKLVIDSLNNGKLSNFEGNGFVSRFEEEFAKFNETKYAVCTNSGTSSLHTALATISLNPEDEVIVPAYTFVSGASVVLQERATPVFADIDKNNYCIDPEDLANKITKRTKVIMPVHIYGHPANMKKINKIAKEFNLSVIEDCAQAHGAKIGTQNVGTFGIAGCYSFAKTKNMTTGEGGMIVTNDKFVCEESKIVRQNGKVSWKIHKRLGYNYRMTEMQAAVGLSQLADLNKINKIRKKNAEIYFKKLKGLGLILPTIDSNVTHAFYKLPVLMPNTLKDKRGVFVKACLGENLPIETGYSIALNKIDFLRGSLPEVSCPVDSVINLPLAPCLSKEQILIICEGLRKVYNEIDSL
ncbi:MAG: DegT/DnrJ/EryC1/StrS family aminotransferase [archaeon]|jgi:dTDP-4-amino-4,6-dideoxygalactose transaminase